MYNFINNSRVFLLTFAKYTMQCVNFNLVNFPVKIYESRQTILQSYHVHTSVSNYWLNQLFPFLIHGYWATVSAIRIGNTV